MHDVFYFTDIHGQLDLFQTMRDWCLKQDPECMIIFGGDACDRRCSDLAAPLVVLVELAPNECQ